MMKRILMFFAMVMCFFGGISVMSAKAETYSGSCGEAVSWNLDTDSGVLTISGTGEMESYHMYVGGPWIDLASHIQTVKIEEGVTYIGGYAFYAHSGYYRNLKHIIIPNSITRIGEGAFESTAFYADDSNWKNGTLYIDNYLIRVKEDITGEYAIEAGTTLMADGAFEFCSSLESVTIPNSMKRIPAGAFYFCSSLESITIPNSITSIGSSAFVFCESLKRVTIPDSVKSIGAAAFSNCTSLEEVTLPNKIANIEDSLFHDCSNLKQVKIPSGVTSIGEYAFIRCYSLESIVIPDNVTSIGEMAFHDCVNLKSVTIPDKVVTIAESAFEWCSGLTDVYYAGSKEDWNKIAIGEYNEDLTEAVIHYNSGNDEEDSTDEISLEYVIENNVVRITPRNVKAGNIVAVLKITNVGVTVNTINYIGTGDVTTEADGDVIKVFVWKSIESMMPLCEPVRIK